MITEESMTILCNEHEKYNKSVRDCKYHYASGYRKAEEDNYSWEYVERCVINFAKWVKENGLIRTTEDIDKELYQTYLNTLPDSPSDT